MLKYHIQTVELTSAQSSISFNNIPQDYKDLYLVTSHRQTQTFSDTNGYPGIRFNNSSTGYSLRRLTGDGSSAASGTSSGYIWVYGNNAAMTANTFSSTTFYIPNYTMSNSKSVSVDSVQENNATGSIMSIVAGLWSGTEAINSLTFFALDSALNNSPQFVAGTSISLYGVKRGDDKVTKVSPVAVGGTVTTSGGYTIHTFNSSGTLVAYRPVEVEYLVVAGGGSGGGNSAIAHGAGAAGGYRSSVSGELSGGGVSAENKLSLTSNTSYAVTVGAGGSGVTQTSGSSSSLDTVTSIGGGRGGSTSANDGLTGGSGGGAGYAGSTFGSGTTGQGFAGGTGSSPSSGVAGGGGGGGAGQVGGNTNASNAGNGGNGVSSLITGSSVTRGGGGGGGSYNLTVGNGGSGGGGAGGNHVSISPVNGTSNTGGGGGAAGGSGAGANGGSGVVIIRYLTP